MSLLLPFKQRIRPEILLERYKKVKFAGKYTSMDANERLINTFATRVRQMLLQYQELKKENAELHAMVGERDRQLRDVEEKLSCARRDYDNLKMAKMLAVSDGDIETSRKRVNKLIRDVNKCITLLSGK